MEEKTTFAWNPPFLFSAWSPDLYSPEAKFLVEKHEWNTFGGEDLLNLESSSLSKTLLFLAPASLSAEAYILSVGDFSLAATWTEK